jgi:hypothetical protein
MLSLARASFHSQMGDLTYPILMNRLWVEMENSRVPGVMRTPPNLLYTGQSFQFQQTPMELRELAMETYFYLLRNGYAVGKPSDDYQNAPNPHLYRWTERGLQWIAGAEPVPENAGAYLEFLRSRVSPLDPVIEQYVLEAVAAFERQAHFASAVMLGAASEKALYALAESLLGAIKNGKERENLQNLFDRRRLFALFALVQKTISVASKKALPHAISEGATTHMMSIYEAIRVQRNDAVHPMNASVSADSVRFLLVSFPYALQRAEALRTWFSSNSLSI